MKKQKSCPKKEVVLITFGNFEHTTSQLFYKLHLFTLVCGYMHFLSHTMAATTIQMTSLLPLKLAGLKTGHNQLQR